jgi:pilus assembly protein Flp/PilA
VTKLASIARSFVREEEGATMVEYALVVAVVALVAVVGFTALGTKVNSTATTAEGKLP